MKKDSPRDSIIISKSESWHYYPKTIAEKIMRTGQVAHPCVEIKREKFYPGPRLSRYGRIKKRKKVYEMCYRVVRIGRICRIEQGRQEIQ